MRMWNVNPAFLCRQHLLGEHLEMHMFLGALKAGKNLDGYALEGLVDINKIIQRHNDLAREMYYRAYNHKTPTSLLDQVRLYKYKGANGYVDKIKSMEELKKRCPFCKKRFEGKL